MISPSTDSAVEQEMVEARDRLAAIVESSDDAIVGKNLDDVVTSWNKAAEAMFGFAACEIIGRPITLIVPPERLGEEASILERVRRGERTDHFEMERLHKDGSVVAVSLSVSPILDDRNRIVGVSEIARDIGEMQRIRRDLERREGLLFAILDASPDALVVIDQQGLIRSFSAAAERLFGFNAMEVEGQSVNMLMPPPYRDEHDGHVARHFATGERHVVGTKRIVFGERKDGSTFPMELAIGEVNVAGMRLFAGFIRDLTERQERERCVNELQSELVHVSRAVELGQMLAEFAHEVADPLMAISFYLGTVRRQLVAGDVIAVQSLVDRVLEQSDRARQIVRRISDHVRKRAADRQVEDLTKVIEESSALALVGAGRDIKLDVRIGDNAREAVIDKIQIQQVLLNLMRNAVEAMTDSPWRELSISTARDGDMVEISVSDTGSGLTRAARSKLFQPFNTTKPNGMGVGLSVCRLIVEAHGGKIRADDGDGAGTVFRLTIPHHVEKPLKMASSGAR